MESFHDCNLIPFTETIHLKIIKILEFEYLWSGAINDKINFIKMARNQTRKMVEKNEYFFDDQRQWPQYTGEIAGEVI